MENFFTKANVIGVLIGIGLLVVGFWALAQGPVNGSLTMNVAPVILTLTYCVVIPIAIFWNSGKREEKNK